ncbi:ribbon-helix-helix protein, CopG family [Uliginosibacterium sediminicola]|uniref:Ribbon-helix-helix protein, CopG family n=1 Tax=Uliginosibacterium sediminicola TaxID=2024550 RepID=A0ABU9Z1K8_9RHOO
MATTLGVKVDDALRERLGALAEAKDRTPHWIIKTALTEYLEREERREREHKEDMARWEHYALTGEHVSAETADAWLNKLAKGERGSWR